MNNYLCNLIIPGFPKSGTSSLHDYLKQHPDICMSNPKEPHYFARSDKWSLGVDYHNSLFKHCGAGCRYYGESSTIYCVSDIAKKRIKDCLLKPKIIFLLRDPVERLISHYRWLYKLGLENRVLLEAIEANGYTFHPDEHLHGNYTGYLEFSSYSKYIPIWMSTFGKNNVYVITSKDLRNDPLLTMNRCFDFLGIDRLGNIKPMAKNITNEIQPMVERSWARMFRSVIPGHIVIAVRRFAIATSIWNKMMKPKITVPELSNAEIEKTKFLLKKECDYYRSILEKT